MPRPIPRTRPRPTAAARRPSQGAALLLAASLSACTTVPPAPVEGIGYREARFAEVQAMRAYRDCRDEGLALDRQARDGGDPGRYLAVARVLESCEADLGPAASMLNVEDRMRAYAVAVQARLKAGDVAGAQAGLDRFAAAFDGRDLYFEDGTSVIDSIAAVLRGGRAPAVGSVARPLADELARLDRWSR